MSSFPQTNLKNIILDYLYALKTKIRIILEKPNIFCKNGPIRVFKMIHFPEIKTGILTIDINL